MRTQQISSSLVIAALLEAVLHVMYDCKYVLLHVTHTS